VVFRFAYPSLDKLLVVLPPSISTASPTPSVLTFTPSDDAYVESGAPNNNYGSATTREVVQSSLKEFLLKFNVTDVNGRPVASAKLRLYSEGSSNKGGDFHRVADQTWQEGTVTWNNAPAADPPILKLGAVSPTLWGEPEHLVRSGHHLADHGRWAFLLQRDTRVEGDRCGRIV